MLPVTLVCSLEEVLRESATAAALWDAPGALLLRYDLGPARSDGLHRLAAGLDGVVEDVHVPLEHACLGCALREDVLPTVAAIARSGRYAHLVLALPVAAEPLPALQALAVGRDGGDRLADLVRVTSVVTVCEGTRVTEDLLGDDLLAERGLGILTGPDGDDGGPGRAVGEVFGHQLDEADLVLVHGPLDETASALLAHTSTAVPAGLHDTSGAELVAVRRPVVEPSESLSRSDLRFARPTGAADASGVFTLDLRSSLPLHPGRLLDGVEDLGAGRLRARGVFWLPSRPGTVVGWDGGGGQLSVGDVGEWSGPAGTRIVVTGADPADAVRVRSAFERILATPEEVSRWRIAADDGLEPWLGPVGRSAEAA